MSCWKVAQEIESSEGQNVGIYLFFFLESISKTSTKPRKEGNWKNSTKHYSQKKHCVNSTTWLNMECQFFYVMYNIIEGKMSTKEVGVLCRPQLSCDLFCCHPKNIQFLDIIQLELLPINKICLDTLLCITVNNIVFECRRILHKVTAKQSEFLILQVWFSFVKTNLSFLRNLNVFWISKSRTISVKW